jgi:hypothetical protein
MEKQDARMTWLVPRPLRNAWFGNLQIRAIPFSGFSAGPCEQQLLGQWGWTRKTSILNWNRWIAFCLMDSLERFPDKVRYNI